MLLGIIDSPDPFIKKYPMIKLSCLSNELTYCESSFRGWTEIIQASPEQYALGPGLGNADRKIGILRRILIPDHEPCFKASMPSYSWDHMHRVEIGCSLGRRAGLTGRGSRDDMRRKRPDTAGRTKKCYSLVLNQGRGSYAGQFAENRQIKSICSLELFDPGVKIERAAGAGNLVDTVGDKALDGAKQK